MKASVFITDVIYAGLKLTLQRRESRSRLFSAMSLAVPSLAYSTDEDYPQKEDKLHHKDHTPEFRTMSSENAEYDELSKETGNTNEATKDELSVYQYPNTTSKEMKRAKSELRKRGWHLGPGNGYKISLKRHNIDRILKDVYEEYSDAAPSLYIFRWSEHFTGSKHTVRTICTMSHILIAGNMNHRAVDLIQSLVRLNGGEVLWANLLLNVLQETHINRRTLITSCSMLVNCYIKERMEHIALKLIHPMEQLNIHPSLAVCNSLLTTLLGSDLLDQAWDFVEYMHRCGLDIVAYTTVIDYLCKMNCRKEATLLLLKIIHMGVSPDSVSVSLLLDSFCKVGELEKVARVLTMFNLSPNIFIYNSFITRLCVQGKMKTATNVFNDMIRLGFLPDCVSYTTMIGGFCKIGKTDIALKLLGIMFKSGTEPSVTTYTVLINGFCKYGDIKTAELFFCKMVSLGFEPDVVTYNVLMDGFGKEGFVRKVLQVYHMMKSAGVSPDIVTYNTMIHCLLIQGFEKEAMLILDEVFIRGISPDVVLFTNLINDFCCKGDIDQALVHWSSMIDWGIKPDIIVCSALLRGYCNARRMEEAKFYFQKMLGFGIVPDLGLYNTLINGFCHAGSTDDAWQLVSEMIVNGVMPNAYTCQILGRDFGRKGFNCPADAVNFKLQELFEKHG
ncbi:pentatricopeptide repeat-containing protein At2g19280 isoform X2 [Impatiens glandulifera]|uniref:pentatricopeptide repeat-containing protein At2g19280 isoform X2 n=1 Tax=Impatiens glandulifera TaxID=253017 RepID=UPI001FB0A46E|nr:pentatricopeptide repeat-containing protein At2g19280 isoform X2 [Impatiens glandulifera]